MRKKSMLITLIGSLLVATCAAFGVGCSGKHTHTFDGITVEVNPSKTVYNAFEEFNPDGMKVVKHCTGEGCDGEEVASGDVTFAYEKEGADKLTADMTKVIIKAADYETDLAITVNKIVVQLPVIEGKEYNGETQTATVAANGLYTVTENNGGTAVGEYDVKLTLTDAVNYKFDGVDGSVATVKFAITKTANEVIMPESIAAIKCGETPVVNATAKENAVITYIYAVEENGEYGNIPDGGLVAGVWYVKAVAAETDTYKATESSAKSFTVEHAFHSWNTQGDETDTGLCVCGEELEDYVFDKVVTDARQDVILTSASNAITLGGISGYKAVKSIKYGENDLGTNISALTLPESINEAVHGEQNLTVVVTDNYDLDHTVQVPVTLITESISTLERLKAVVSVNARNLGKRCDGKYYILANDIQVDNYFFNPLATDSSSAVTWDDPDNGFAGTFDGRNHSLIGGNMFGGGMFCSLESATVKNIKFDQVTISGPNRTLIAGTVRNTLLENIEINIASEVDVGDGGSYFGIIASHDIAGVTMKNVTINAPKATLPYIIGKHPRNTLDKMPTCENVVVTVKYLGAISENNSGKIALNAIPGLVVKMSESITLADEYAIDPTELESSDVRCDLKTAYQSLNIKQVLKNGEALDKSLYEMKGDEGSKYFYIADLIDIITAADYNTTVTFTIVFDGGEGSDIKLDVNVKVLGNEKQVALETRQDVVLKDAAGEKTTATLDLGDYASYTIKSATYGNDEALTISGSTITIPEGLKNGTHGEQNFVVFASKDGVDYRITVPVTVVTESISTFNELASCVTYKSGYAAEYQKGKYFILADDITVTSYNTGSDGSSWGPGFAGTLDGRNKSLVGGTMYGGGLFGELNGATIKNIKFKDVDCAGSNNGDTRVLFARHIKAATISNVEIYIKANTNMSTQSIICRGHVGDLTISDVLIDATGSKLPYVLGSGGVDTTVKATNVTIKADALECVYIRKGTKIMPDGSGFIYECTATAEA